MSFVVDWFSLEEMKVLQGVSVLTSVWAREWQYKDILNDIDLAKILVRGNRKSCLVMSALVP